MVEEQVQKLGALVLKELGSGVHIELTGGDLRIGGTDKTVAVAITENDTALVFAWRPKAERWRVRRDLDPYETLGLLEWRNARENDMEGSEFDD